jgi:hypothetical protein
MKRTANLRPAASIVTDLAKLTGNDEMPGLMKTAPRGRSSFISSAAACVSAEHYNHRVPLLLRAQFVERRERRTDLLTELGIRIDVLKPVH